MRNVNFIVVFWLVSTLSSSAQTASSYFYSNIANANYWSFVSRFWVGSQTSGHFALINGNTLAAAYVPPNETEPLKPWLWQYAESWTVPYAYWKATGSPDAQARLAAEWGWVKSRWSLSDLGVCGGVGGQSASTLDDADWVVRGLVELYEATNDVVALNYAKAMIDCMNGSNGFYDNVLGGLSHWYDATPATATWSGGVVTLTLSRAATNPSSAGQLFNVASFTNTALNGTWTALSVVGNVVTYALASNPGTIGSGGWYHSGQGKGMNSLNYALAEIEYYLKACPVEGGSCPTTFAYYTAGKAELDWANSTLDRSQNSNCPQTDHLYWASVGYGSPPMPEDSFGTFCTRPNVILQGTSVVSLFANMGGAAANALVYGQGSISSYSSQAVNTTSSILALELFTCGAFLDDRDARGNGFAGYDFAVNVSPLLPSTVLAATGNGFLSTANTSIQFNRGVDGSFSGDWCGPWNGVWTGLGFNPDQLEISAQSVILTSTALLYGN